MDKEKVKTKSFEVAPVDNINKDLELVNQHTVKPLTADEVYMFKVVDSDFNKTPGALNDVSDVDVSELQYTSPILEKMKADGVYDNLCGLIRSIKMADKSDAFIISQIKKRFGTYCGGLTQPTFKRWLGGEYKKIS